MYENLRKLMTIYENRCTSTKSFGNPRKSTEIYESLCKSKKIDESTETTRQKSKIHMVLLQGLTLSRALAGNHEAKSILAQAWRESRSEINLLLAWAGIAKRGQLSLGLDGNREAKSILRIGHMNSSKPQQIRGGFAGPCSQGMLDSTVLPGHVPGHVRSCQAVKGGSPKL